MSTASAEFDALNNTLGVISHIRDAVNVEGADGRTFLQGQLSQDVSQLSPGDAAWSFVLQPQGKIDVFVRVSCLDDSRFVLDTDLGFGNALHTRLKRFLLRADVKMTQQQLVGFAFRGERANASMKQRFVNHEATYVLPFYWRNAKGFDVFGSALSLQEMLDKATEAIPEVAQSSFDALRIANGFPRMGAEVHSQTIPGEIDADDLCISLTKGCYTGQELVARIVARGNNVPRRLRIIEFASAVEPVLGAHIRLTQRSSTAKPLGVITSYVQHPLRAESWIALAFIRRDIFPPYDARVEWNGASHACTIRSLPDTLRRF